MLYTVNSSLLNNATHKVLKFVDHKYIYYLTSQACFSPLGFHQVYHSDIQKGPQGFYTLVTAIEK